MKFGLLVLFLILSCQKQEPSVVLKELRGEVFGSYYQIKYRGELSEKVFQERLNVFFEDFNKEFSTYRNDSVISAFNQSPANKKLKVSTRFIEMLEMAKQFHSQTNGAFEPTLGPVIKAWGFGGARKKAVDSAIQSARTKVGFHHVKWNKNEIWKDLEGVELDVNAFAPGWAADLIGEMLIQNKVTDFMVDISGEILFKGQKDVDQKWVAGIEMPSSQSERGIQLAFKMNDQALATSGNYRQFYDENGERKSHIIDPATGSPVTHQISSATVLAETAAAADAWGTAMMVLGEKGLSLSDNHGKKVLLLKADKVNQFQEITSVSMKSFLEANRL